MNFTEQMDVDGKQVTLKLMDDSWIINQCVGAHPIVPKTGVVWNASQYCNRLPIPGNNLPAFMKKIKDDFGNCAVIAWHANRVLGHLVFIPKQIAYNEKSTSWQWYRKPINLKTLVIINFTFCSLSGHEFRRKGIGTAMVAMMLNWAQANKYRTVEVYDTPSGLWPRDWLDACIPPYKFWEKQGFDVFVKHGPNYFDEKRIAEYLRDNPRNNQAEQESKINLAQKIREGNIEKELLYSYDLVYTIDQKYRG